MKCPSRWRLVIQRTEDASTCIDPMPVYRTVDKGIYRMPVYGMEVYKCIYTMPVNRTASYTYRVVFQMTLESHLEGARLEGGRTC